MSVLLFIITIGIFILFMTWQFKVLKKYAFDFDRFKIDERKRYLEINGRRINFYDIDCVTFEEREQPSTAEKLFTKSGFYCFMSEMSLHLKDGTSVKCRFNYKGALYAALKKLSPYVNIDGNFEAYNPNSHQSLILTVILITAIFFIVFSLH